MSVDAGVAFEIITVLKQEAEDRFVKGLGILVGDKMTTGNDGKLGIGNGFCNKTGMLFFYHVIIAGYDKGWTLYL